MFIFWFCYHFRWFFKYVFNIADYNTFFKYANIASDYNAFSCISNYNVFEDISLWSFRLKYLSGISLIFQLLRFFFFYYILYNFSGISLKILIFFQIKISFPITKILVRMSLNFKIATFCSDMSLKVLVTRLFQHIAEFFWLEFFGHITQLSDYSDGFRHIIQFLIIILFQRSLWSFPLQWFFLNMSLKRFSAMD